MDAVADFRELIYRHQYIHIDGSRLPQFLSAWSPHAVSQNLQGGQKRAESRGELSSSGDVLGSYAVGTFAGTKTHITR